MKDGEIIRKQGYGLANLELGVPNRPSTAFNIGSMAKQFTGFGIALLEEEGKVSKSVRIRRVEEIDQAALRTYIQQALELDAEKDGPQQHAGAHQGAGRGALC